MLSLPSILGAGLYDMVVICEEYERDATGRDWKRIRAREAFNKAVYNAKGVTHVGSIVVMRVMRGWDRRTNIELGRWNARKVCGDVAMVGHDIQALDKVTDMMDNKGAIWR